MRKVLVLIAILAAAAACGASQAASSAGAGHAPLAAQAPTKSGTNVPGSTDFAPNQSATVPVQGPQVIRQAQLTVSVTSGSFDTKLADVRALVEREQGFIAGTDAQSSSQTDDRIRSGVVTFMVPADKFDATIDELSKLGKVQNEHLTGQDVSAQYVDLQARLANEEAQRNAMIALLAKAQTVNEIIAVQNQLGQITGQIEQLKGQIQYIDHNVAFSTITVQMTEAGAPVTAAPSDSWGFASALSDAAHNFVATLNYLITGLGAVGPVLILLALGFLLWRRAGSPGWRHA
jgi:hypothetical protein